MKKCWISYFKMVDKLAQLLFTHAFLGKRKKEREREKFAQLWAAAVIGPAADERRDSGGGGGAPKKMRSRMETCLSTGRLEEHVRQHAHTRRSIKIRRSIYQQRTRMALLVAVGGFMRTTYSVQSLGGLHQIPIAH